MKVDLAGKVAVVTGAASGIGAAIAQAIAWAGADGLLLTDRDAEGLAGTARDLAETGSAIDQCVADLTDPEAPRRIIAAAIARFGRVDALVNAAGLTTRAALSDGAPDTWDTLFGVNAKAPFFLMQQAVADMTSRRAPGSIVNITSVNAACGTPDLAIYSASKGALATLTRNAANANAGTGIRVNGITLGWVATPSEHIMQSQTLGRGDGWQSETAAQLPLGRLITAQEVARLALFLLSNKSEPMTGSLVDFDQTVAVAP